MGYSWNGRCWPDTASALNAFRLDASTIDTYGVNSPTSVTVNSSGLVSWTIATRTFSGSTTVSRWGTVQLETCSDPGMNQYSEQSLLFIVAIFFAFILGFKTGFNSYI